MFFEKILTVVCIIILFSCESSVNSAELLSVRVESTTPVAGDELKYYKAGLANQKGAGNVMLDVYRVWGDHYPNAKFTASSMETHKEVDHTLYEITVIFDGVPDDDSVRGYRYDMKISSRNGALSVVALDESWRCLSDRGHQGFSSEPCV